ncbi:MAG: hypothetical protein EPO26_18510 [Chloroflexota bacterium]|nr:MAG: hypothetical protein EPO26_18510 [Chloroflexota bacterium]
MWRRFLPIAVIGLVGCGSSFNTGASTTGAGASGKVVFVSAVGRLATSTPEGSARVLATPTFDPGFGSILTPLAGTPSATVAPERTVQTVQLRPTRTMAATVTPFPTVFIPPTATRNVHATPTRPPTKPTNTTVPRATDTPRATATSTPVDPNEANGPNSDLSNATPLTLNTDTRGLISSPDDVDVYQFDVDDDTDQNQIVVTLTGLNMESFQLFLITPGRRSAAYGTPVGTIARHIVYPVRGDTGTWFVEVSPKPGKRLPRDYALKVQLRSLVIPVDEGEGE